MEKGKKNSFMRRFFTLMLAFVTMLSSMGIGSLGVETAFATSEESNIIRNYEEFRSMNSSGTYELGADITVTAPYSEEFSGTFDGKGYTVTLAIEGSESNVGLFTKLGSNAVVKNVNTVGSVSGKECVGGITGSNAGKIISCKNTAEISATDRYVGGIAGKTTAVIQDCYNTGEIQSTRTKSGVNLAGITGRLDGSTSILSNCYNIGSITVNQSTSNYGAIAGYVYNGTVNNCYFLENGNLTGTNEYNKPDQATSKSNQEMKSPEFAALLGEGFRAKAGDYPTLAWEVPTAAVPFKITPSNAVLTITDESSNVVYAGTERTISLPAGSYTYTVTCEGYTSKTDGSFTVSEEQANNSVTLETQSVSLVKDESLWKTVTFNVTGSNNYIIAVKRGNEIVEAINENGSVYKM